MAAQLRPLLGLVFHQAGALAPPLGYQLRLPPVGGVSSRFISRSQGFGYLWRCGLASGPQRTAEPRGNVWKVLAIGGEEIAHAGLRSALRDLGIKRQ